MELVDDQRLGEGHGPTVRLYHRTRAASSILADGFREATGYYLTDRLWTGVWVSDSPHDEGGAGGDVLEIDVDADIADLEWVEEGKPYREWLVPADLLNASPIRLLDAPALDGDAGSSFDGSVE